MLKEDALMQKKLAVKRKALSMLQQAQARALCTMVFLALCLPSGGGCRPQLCKGVAILYMLQSPCTLSLHGEKRADVRESKRSLSKRRWAACQSQLTTSTARPRRAAI